MKVLEPVLMQVSAALAAAAGAGSNADIDFDFGNLEGAKLLMLEYSYLSPANGTEQLTCGLKLSPVAGTPASRATLVADPDVIGMAGYGGNLTTSGQTAEKSTERVDLSALDIKLTRNPTLQMFVSSSPSTAGVTLRIYYKRVLFTQAELGAFVAIRR